MSSLFASLTWLTERPQQNIEQVQAPARYCPRVYYVIDSVSRYNLSVVLMS